MGLSRRLQADLWIVSLAAIWGGTFVVIKRALDDISPLLFVALRFAIAAPLIYPLVPRGAFRGDGARLRGTLRGGAVTGLLLFSGFTFQTLGIQYTTPARSAFITGMYLVFTPLLAVLLKRRLPSVNSLVGAAVATVGLHLLTNPGGEGSFGLGESLTLLCALSFAAHLIAVDHYTRLYDKRTLAFLQVAAVALLAIVPTVAFEQIRFEPTARLGAAVAITAVLGTALAFFVLNSVQAWTTPTRAAIIFAAEPVFAAVTSWIVEGEVLGTVAMLGAGLILAGMLISEIGPFRKRAESAA